MCPGTENSAVNNKNKNNKKKKTEKDITLNSQRQEKKQ